MVLKYAKNRYQHSNYCYENILEIVYLLGTGIVITQCFHTGNMKKPFCSKINNTLKSHVYIFRGNSIDV